MSEILKLVNEIRMEVLKSVVLESFLDSVLIFLGTFMVLSLINFYRYLAIIPGVAAFIFFIFTRMRQFRLKTVEDRNPAIRDMLRTAADNANQDNFVIRALNSDLIKKMRQVTSSSLMKLNRLVYKIIAVAVLSVMIIFISTMQLRLLDMDKFLHPGFNPDAREGSLQDIFGDKENVPKIGKNPVNIQLNPMSYEINIDKINEAKPKEFRSDFPIEVVATQEKSYEENIPREQQIIIKNYFASITS